MVIDITSEIRSLEDGRPSAHRAFAAMVHALSVLEPDVALAYFKVREAAKVISWDTQHGKNLMTDVMWDIMSFIGCAFEIDYATWTIRLSEERLAKSLVDGRVRMIDREPGVCLVDCALWRNTEERVMELVVRPKRRNDCDAIIVAKLPERWHLNVEVTCKKAE